MKKKAHVYSIASVIAISVIIFVFNNYVHAQINSESPVVIGMPHTSIVTLIALPSRYDQSKVRVVGHVRIKKDANAIYLSKSDAQYEITKNGVWLELSTEQKSMASMYEGKVCLIEGRWSASNNGHMRLWSGALEEITTIEVLEKNKSQSEINE